MRSYRMSPTEMRTISWNQNSVMRSNLSNAKIWRRFARIPAVRKQVAKLLIENKIKGAEVRQLDKVLKNRKASTALKKDGFKAAKQILGKTDPPAASKILREMQALTRALGKMGHEDITLLKSSAKARSILNELSRTVGSVAAIAGVNLRGKNG